MTWRRDARRCPRVSRITKKRPRNELHPKSWTPVQPLGCFFMTKYNEQFKQRIVDEYLAGGI
ncbi:TPA: hypothetical protein ACV4T7_006670, partial [Burkholderia ambifaria]